MPLHRFVIAVRAAITRDALFAAQGTVVVACSGGADSLALLHALHTLCGRPGAAFPHVLLHVAHVDHGLRGAAGQADAEFVRETAAGWHLPTTISTITQAENERWRGSVERSARVARYGRLRAIADSVGATCIALGHTLDDQAETVLMHLIRGSGLDGLAGMRPRNGDLIRPLLGLRRADTEAYCTAQALHPRDDATNRDPHYLRNRVRHELLPLLETYQAQIRPTLARNAPLIAQDRDYLEAATDEVWVGTLAEQHPGTIVLKRAALKALHPALRFRVLRRAALLVGSNLPDAHLDASSIQRLDRVVVDHSGEQRTIELSNDVLVQCARQTVIFAARMTLP